MCDNMLKDSDNNKNNFLLHTNTFLQSPLLKGVHGFQKNVNDELVSSGIPETLKAIWNVNI